MAKKPKEQQIELSQEVLGALADAFGKSVLTISRWVRKKDDRLISDKAREVFARKNVNWN
ncbi:hypothetical protein [Paraflavitalea pollutisoli]|uniref:hypothetical protein n=1 Tax=Paraflavitalea pollutisoli TaxID=3034143 RepID=UPI0023EC4A67|nr:hypothetical protein [Paraflavitalea sp. H1-2-19X]